MCNLLYYWVTVRNSQSYWHLEHMGETLACTRGGAGGGGAEGLQGDGRGGGGNTAGRVCVHGWGKVGYFSLISVDATAFLWVFCILFSCLPPKAVTSPFFFFLPFYWVMKNNKE